MLYCIRVYCIVFWALRADINLGFTVYLNCFAYDVDIHCKLKHRCMCAKVVPATAKPAGKRTRVKTWELQDNLSTAHLST